MQNMVYLEESSIKVQCMYEFLDLTLLTIDF